MNSTYKFLIAILLSMSFSTQAKPVDESSISVIQKNIQNLGLEAQKVERSDVDGLLRVYTERGLFYFSVNGQYLIHGKIYDVSNSVENITERALMSVRVDGVKQFKDSMIVYPAKNEKYKVSVFVDTSCGYCRKLHEQMQAYNDIGITVQYLAFPRSGITGPTFKEMSSIWCSANAATTMTDAMNGERFSGNNKICNAVIEKQYKLGMQVGVTGTPAIVLENGKIIPGYQAPHQLIQSLSSE